MAQQLRAEEQEVDLVVLIDPMGGPIRLIRALGGFIRGVGNLIRLGADKQLDWFLRLRYVSRVLRRSQDEYTEHVDRLMQRWQEEHPRRFSLIPAAEALRQDGIAVFIEAASSDVPHQYPVKMTNF